ncbi:ABC transporter substrate-binding (seleno)protein SaoB [Maridesulfovibrio frigidus]|uniref:ABC transporter substrate-binding (seleno)protein SaoB n=1 Tax=Maridesulfovibrio frigidus TaxID=340956 RepID=UPI0004E0BFB8|nr:ABC transporter substrate-binding (seleno)protein SaoB [Maridesulfovibrio frigidus]
MKGSLLILLGLVVALSVAAAFGSPTESTTDIRIGTPSDTAGLLADLAVEEADIEGLTTVSGIKTFQINDCCTPVAQWAMSSQSVDLALMCPDSAGALVAKDARFNIIGPILYNSEVLVSRLDTKILSVGVAQGRTRLEPILKEALGEEISVSPMLPTSLPYAYKKKVVDAVVVDFFTALNMPGQITRLAQQKNENLSYVLVIRKDLQITPLYSRIIKAFENAATKMSNSTELQAAVLKYKKTTLNDEEVKLWQTLRIRFVSPISMPISLPKL